MVSYCWASDALAKGATEYYDSQTSFPCKSKIYLFRKTTARRPHEHYSSLRPIHSFGGSSRATDWARLYVIPTRISHMPLSLSSITPARCRESTGCVKEPRDMNPLWPLAENELNLGEK